jgi:hypothetical protein
VSEEVLARAVGESESSAYRDGGYVLLERLFPPAVMRAFYERIDTDLDLGGAPRFAVRNPLLSKVALEVYSHQYPPMATFLWALTPTISRIAGIELLPTYAYFRIYQAGDVCRVHFDRPACEHSLSLTVQLADEKPWALSIERERLDTPSSTIDPDFGGKEIATLPMRAGDGVMYQGVNHRHGRLEPNPNGWSAHLFLHWVDARGPYADHAFDQVVRGVAANLT